MSEVRDLPLTADSVLDLEAEEGILTKSERDKLLQVIGWIEKALEPPNQEGA